MSRVRTLAQTILENPKYVTINEARAAEVAYILTKADFKLEIPTWDFAPLYPQYLEFEEMCQFYLTFNAINYCYFDQDGKKFQDGDLSGSTLAAMRLTEHWEEIRDPLFLSRVDENYLLSELFRAENPISLVKERTEALREVGQLLNAHSSATGLATTFFRNLFKKYKSNAYYVSQALPDHLPSWRDPFFKRAQLFVGMVYGRFQHEEVRPFDEGLEDLTVFADYRVPETLIRMGVVVPKPPLLTKLHRREFLGTGSHKELELRAASIVGADAIMRALDAGTGRVNSLHMDYLLWSAGRRVGESPEGLFVQNHIVHHLTMTTDY
jgi:hypothetical protein